MHPTLLISALALQWASSTLAQAVPEGIAPDSPPPEGCATTVEGSFTLGIATMASRKRESAQQTATEALSCTLEDGILKDPHGRIGSVVANYQFQFDGPPQAGAIYTGGFSRCENGSLALGGSTIWWRCMSGEFGNLYDRWIGDQCSEVRILALVDGGDGVDKKTPTPAPSSTGVLGTGVTTTVVMTTGTGTWRVEVPTVTSNGTVSATSSVQEVVSSTEGGSGDEAAPTDAPTDAPTGSPDAPPAGAASSTRVLGPEVFGIVVGIIVAVWFF